MLYLSKPRGKEHAMQGKVGDEIIIDGPKVDDSPRAGEVLEVLETGGVTHYRVRWDDGTDCIFFPQSDARFVLPGALGH
jgi:Domain of unknown function (DUF1918)